MNVLYLTYDGLTDFIGQSQVLPYLIGCARSGHHLTIISFEKLDRLTLLGRSVRDTCERESISWLPQPFRSFPPLLAKVIDQSAMRRAAYAAADAQRFDLVHCRSYVAGLIGLSLKRDRALPFLFDMRGFWVDQRREGGRWRDDSMVGRHLYKRWKGYETEMVAAANQLVVLTEAASAEIRSWPVYNGTLPAIIPCCADFEIFQAQPLEQRRRVRAELGLAAEAPVLGYLGSLGTVYLLQEHCRLFASIQRRQPNAQMLFIGRVDRQAVISACLAAGVTLRPDSIVIQSAEREEVARLIGAADAGTCFIIPSFSSLGVSATKLGEYLACGLPVIANQGVGDVSSILAETGGGVVLRDFSEESIERAADAFLTMGSTDRFELRARAREILDLPRAVEAYTALYNQLEAAK